MPQHGWSLKTLCEMIITISNKRPHIIWFTCMEGRSRICKSTDKEKIAKFRLKLKKGGKPTRPFKYDLNHIPYNYTVEMRNRFKWLGLTECLVNYGRRFMTLYWRDRDQDNPQEKEMQKSKMTVWGGLTNSCEKKRSKKQRRKGNIYPFECRVPKKSKEK